MLKNFLKYFIYLCILDKNSTFFFINDSAENSSKGMLEERLPNGVWEASVRRSAWRSVGVPIGPNQAHIMPSLLEKKVRVTSRQEKDSFLSHRTTLDNQKLRKASLFLQPWLSTNVIYIQQSPQKEGGGKKEWKNVQQEHHSKKDC